MSSGSKFSSFLVLTAVFGLMANTVFAGCWVLEAQSCGGCISIPAGILPKCTGSGATTQCAFMTCPVVDGHCPCEDGTVQILGATRQNVKTASGFGRTDYTVKIQISCAIVQPCLPTCTGILCSPQVDVFGNPILNVWTCPSYTLGSVVCNNGG